MLYFPLINYYLEKNCEKLCNRIGVFMKTSILDGIWQLKPCNLENVKNFTSAFNDGKTIPVLLPGDIHSALIKAGVIVDPYYGKNEIDVQWVGKENWILSKEINIKKNFLVGQQFITFEFADTFFHLRINGVDVGKGNNMFRKWRFNISGLLQVGINTVEIVFDSAEGHAIEIAKKLPYPIPYSEYPVFSPHRNLIRKVQCHAGWDWGPCLMVFGIYESIVIEQTNKGFIDYVNTRYYQNGDDWQIEVTTSYTAITDSTIPVSIKIDGPGIEPVITGTPVNVFVGENIIHHTITVRKPLLWWPAGSAPEDEDKVLTGRTDFRENPLYSLTVTANQDVFTKKIGFRTLDLIAKNDDAGKSMFFRVNGRDIFAKGANWIPCDALPSNQTYEKYEKLLRSMVNANMNIIRVWGGGQYEKDCFYELCDKLGIIVWQDCMFACSLYPSTPSFLKNVREEIRHQIRRLKDHPSIGLWCGNNEDVGALTWYPESRANRDRYIIDYDRLNEGVLAEEITQLDPDRAWWPSSPSAGPNDFSDNWHSDGKGDMHYWSVWHDKEYFSSYLTIKPRFVSEFGYESFPSMTGVLSYTPKDQLNLTSPVMEFHQRSPSGNSIILENFSRYFRFPNGIANMLYLSQVQQALAIKTAIDYWRSLRPHCMGSIIWQLNDVYPVASWSSIEYSGKWKLLHYEAKKFFAPVNIIAYNKDKKISFCVLNDTNKTQKLTATISMINFDGKKCCEDMVLEIVSEKDSSQIIYEVELNQLSQNSTDFFFAFNISNENGIIFQDIHFPALPKECDLQVPNIDWAITESPDGKLFVNLTTDKPAFYVCLDQKKLQGRFSSNMITLLPNQSVVVEFISEEKNITAKKLEKSLSIISLRDTY